MAGQTQAPTRRRRPTARQRAAAGQAAALMVIDHQRLQGAAWAEFHTARKRLDKATRDLHRHEEVDVPAFDSWLHRTFPLLVTALRELHAEVGAKAHKVQAVHAQAAYAGGSPKRIWRQQKEWDKNPKPAAEDERESEFDDDDGRSTGPRHEAEPEDFERVAGPAPSLSARAIYRRLVQRLHPDRGGEWTPTRQRLWHEVQQAWAAADTDWLSRLEVDWETANEVVGPNSPLSHLRRAIAELDAARRDTERKLSAYRRSPQWRFTRNEKNRPLLHRRILSEFEYDLSFLKRQLDHLNATIAAWEEDWTRADCRPKSRSQRGRR